MFSSKMCLITNTYHGHFIEVHIETLYKDKTNLYIPWSNQDISSLRE